MSNWINNTPCKGWLGKKVAEKEIPLKTSESSGWKIGKTVAEVTAEIQNRHGNTVNVPIKK